MTPLLISSKYTENSKYCAKKLNGVEFMMRERGRLGV